MGERRRRRSHDPCRPRLTIFRSVNRGRIGAPGARSAPGEPPERPAKSGELRWGPAGPSLSEPRALPCPSGARERGGSGESLPASSASQKAQQGARRSKAGRSPARPANAPCCGSAALFPAEEARRRRPPRAQKARRRPTQLAGSRPHHAQCARCARLGLDAGGYTAARGCRKKLLLWRRGRARRASRRGGWAGIWIARAYLLTPRQVCAEASGRGGGPHSAARPPGAPPAAYTRERSRRHRRIGRISATSLRDHPGCDDHRSRAAVAAKPAAAYAPQSARDAQAAAGPIPREARAGAQDGAGANAPWWGEPRSGGGRSPPSWSAAAVGLT